MPPFSINAVFSAIACAIVAVLVIIPLARRIPLKLMEDWQGEIFANTQVKMPVDSQQFSLAQPEKAIIFLAAAFTGLIVVLYCGTSVAALALCVFFLALILLAAINLKHQLLPNIIVFPILWLGLLYHAVVDDSSTYIFAVCIAYGLPFLLMQLYWLITRKQGLGDGDLKCFAMTAAWFGLKGLPLFFGAFIIAGFAQGIISMARSAKGMPTALPHVAGAIAALVIGSAF